MKNATLCSRGFTLIAALLLLVLMSGMSIGLLMMVNTEQRAGSNDVENSLAYRGAEAGVEQMASSIATQFNSIQSPNAAAISGLSVFQPTIPGITFKSFNIVPHTNTDGTLKTGYQLINGGPNSGLYASVIGVDLDVVAERPMGDQVHMLRTVEVALIPVFQFGAFSDSDLALFNSPDLDFAGRVHTNGDLYLGVSNGNDLIFHDKVTAYGDIVRMTYPNGSAVSNDDGNVRIPTTSGGCDSNPPSSSPQASCRTMSTTAGIYREGSIQNGAGSADNTNWPTISNTTYQSWIMDGNYGKGNAGTTPVKLLSLPFVSGATQPFEIIRRPPLTGQPGTTADASRLAMLGQIRVLLSDNQADLHLIDWNGDASQDIHLDNTDATYGAAGVPVAGVAGGNTFFAMAALDNTVKNADLTTAKFDADFVQPFGVAAKSWPLVGGWLLVETKWAADNKWHGVTKEWLQLGFARGLVPPASAYAAIHPKAILTFQMLADRNGDANTTNANESSTVGGVNARWNFFPINFYDAREGEARDWTTALKPAAASCSVNGVMNAIELDVFNLRRWLLDGAGTGPNVDAATQNGYVLYFSDRRGEGDAATGILPQGEYGFEDVVNNANGDVATPDGDSETKVPIRTATGIQNFSPEDTDLSGVVDNYGGKNVGDGFGLHATVNLTGKPNPLTTRIANCYTTGRKNRVTGARHVLKLVDGAGQNRLPMPGFTVAAENPVYVQGDYNSSNADTTWNTPPVEPSPLTHSAAAVIADSVTLLSNNWLDTGYSAPATANGSLYHPFDATTASGYRPAVTTYYRTAIAAGKPINFPHPGYTTSTTFYGTDGGLHNFLRFLESWNGQTLNYKGSMVSLYYSNYDTGTFKCCNYMVYQPPSRNYDFDQLFSDPKNLPPGTPMFKDVNNLTYRQDFTPH